MTLASIILLIFLSGVFSASEIALTALNKAKVLAIKDDGRFGSKAIEKLKKTPQRVLVSILVGNQTVNTLATFLATIWAFEIFQDSTKVDWLIIPFTFVLILFGSILPKTLALGFAETFARIVAYPLLFFVTLVRPITFFFEGIINGFSKFFGITSDQLSSTSGKEIEAMIEIGADQGVIEEGQDVFLRRLLRFGETKVKEIMIPLKEIAALDMNITRDELINFLDKNNYMEFPIYEQDINAIKGITSLHDLMHLLKTTTRKFPLKTEHFTRPVVIPKTTTFIQLFKLLTEENKRLAIIIDEYGQTVGMVTLARIMEEITGISAQDNTPPPTIKKINRNVWEVDAAIRVSQLEEALNITLPYPEAKVMSLVVLEALKRFPEVDEMVKIDGIDIKIKRIEKNVVKKLEVSKGRKINKKK